MHPRDAALLKQGIASAKGTKPARPFTYLFGPLMLLVYGSKITAIPVITPLSDGQIIDELGGITVHHLPGHSDGQVALTIPTPDKTILFAADVIGNYPRIGLPYAVLDKPKMHASIRRLCDLGAGADLMVFGHGKPLAAPFHGLTDFANSLG
jgi:glyoxylase-like metal-dependent hydrolase (beta-lactamase superfamily II)